MKSLYKTLLYIGVGSLVGFLYYKFVGCASGNCRIASNPFNSMLYMGFVGFLLSGNGCCCSNACKTNSTKEK